MAIKARYDQSNTGQTLSDAHYALEDLGLRLSGRGAYLVVRPFVSGAARGSNLSPIGETITVPLSLAKYGQLVATPVGAYPNKLAAIRAAATAHLLSLPAFAGAQEDTDVDEPTHPSVGT